MPYRLDMFLQLEIGSMGSRLGRTADKPNSMATWAAVMSSTVAVLNRRLATASMAIHLIGPDILLGVLRLLAARARHAEVAQLAHIRHQQVVGAFVVVGVQQHVSRRQVAMDDVAGMQVGQTSRDILHDGDLEVWRELHGRIVQVGAQVAAVDEYSDQGQRHRAARQHTHDVGVRADQRHQCGFTLKGVEVLRRHLLHIQQLLDGHIHSAWQHAAVDHAEASTANGPRVDCYVVRFHQPIRMQVQRAYSLAVFATGNVL